MKTDYEGQAKKLLDLMEQTDLIIVAGGDGTLQERTEDALTICVEPDTLSKGDFIAMGSTKLTDPSICPESGVCVQASSCQLNLPKDGAGFYSIDNEEYEAMPVEVTLLPRKLNFFCDSGRKHDLLN
ncbi:UNVERIFIED_CONTAM: hypothetical protein FKN15_028573 [Acipenser sinensis]